ncbi:unnamed protein product, partial [Chrysoparadoxa australica]
EHHIGLSEVEQMAQCSGKLVLLDKLLPRLKEQGHRVLLFSQFKIMLDILEDYLNGRRYNYGRIDGCITGRERQKAIDKYQEPGSDAFVMLLTTRAGGVGINLTAADTCIIYDSDWNPQNDLQAQARCHRIGQKKSVKVYRLLASKTYEMHLFRTANKKLGLDQAVLSTAGEGKSGNQALSKKEVEMLLKYGAHDVFREEEEGASAELSKKFCEEDIDSILGRAAVIKHASAKDAGGTKNLFSTATFVSGKDGEENQVDVNDPDFWSKVVGLTLPEEKDQQLGRRIAATGSKQYAAASDVSDDSDQDLSDYDPEEDMFLAKGRAADSFQSVEGWTASTFLKLYKHIATVSFGNWSLLNRL